VSAQVIVFSDVYSIDHITTSRPSLASAIRLYMKTHEGGQARDLETSMLKNEGIELQVVDEATE
jgi:hypothetical protein